MMGRVLHKAMRKGAAGLAVLALLLLALAPMPGRAFSSTSPEICGHESPSGQVPAGGFGQSDHGCDLCSLHCHLGWMPPVDGVALVVQSLFPQGLAFAPTGGGRLAALGAYAPHNPRAPPASA